MELLKKSDRLDIVTEMGVGSSRDDQFGGGRFICSPEPLWFLQCKYGAADLEADRLDARANRYGRALQDSEGFDGMLREAKLQQQNV